MRILRGSQFMMLSVFFVALLGLGIKLLSHIPTIEVIFFNYLAALVASFTVLKYRQIPIWGQKRGLLLARSIASILGTALHFFTLQHISLPSAITLHYTAPIFASLIGIVIAKEPVRLQQWFFFSLSLAGITLLNGCSLNKASWYILIGLVGAFFRGLSHSIVRKIAHQVHPLVVTFYGSFVAVPLSGIYLLHNFVMPQAQDVLMLSIVSVLSYLAHYYTIKAYQLGPVGLVSATTYMAVVYALLLGYLFLEETLPQRKLLGIGLILLSMLLNIFYHQRKAT